MADKSTKIPAWQRATSLSGAEDVKAEPAVATDPGPTVESDPELTKAAETEATHERERNQDSKSKDDMDGLRDTAANFLTDPSIKNAPRERKVAFLRGKGLKPEEIDLLLSSQDEVVQRQPPSALAYSHPPSQPPPQSQPQSQPPRDLPPVIAYPEFLVHSEKPPPLVTKTLLVNTAYVTAGIYGTLYALSKYIINPMQAQLNDARHDLLSHSTNQLDAFNSKLRGLVSVPPTTSRPGTALRQRDEDEDSATSDPTELFHRDFGTQTSPELSRRNSLSKYKGALKEPATPTDKAHATLTRLSELVKDTAFTSEAALAKDNTAGELRELVTNLNEMAYSSAAYRYGAGSGGYAWTGASAEKAQDDEIERLVKDVKALKGRFLGVRNFPRVGVR